MTREQIFNMTAQELAEATAVHVMKWEWFDGEVNRIHNTSGYWFDPASKQPRMEWNPAEDIRDAMDVEGKVLSRKPGIGNLYVHKLQHVLGIWVHVSDLVHASASDRCKAALLAVMGL